MISEPEAATPRIFEGQRRGLTFHVEAVADAVQTARRLRRMGCRHVGITLNPATAVEKIYPAMEEVDHVLVMSVVPGFSGQKFMPQVLPKVEAVKKRLRANQRLEIDGGIHEQTIRRARDAGVDWFVVASAIFDEKDRAAAIARLRRNLGGG